MPQHDQRTPLSDVQARTIAEELRGQLMWRTARLDELRALIEGGGADDASLQGVLADLAATERAVTEIRASLDRLADGSYGRCAGCGDMIPYERLKIRPFTRHCMPCQRRHEVR